MFCNNLTKTMYNHIKYKQIDLPKKGQKLKINFTIRKDHPLIDVKNIDDDSLKKIKLKLKIVYSKYETNEIICRRYKYVFPLLN